MGEEVTVVVGSEVAEWEAVGLAEVEWGVAVMEVAAEVEGVMVAAAVAEVAQVGQMGWAAEPGV